ncbi:MAG: dolichol-P-glucose synthetase [Candidatus Vogelbacteria bacterium CG10_big_fil_rev_8_21_14_0_10_49_38]|uniref:Dolichol-P-glucose synthetase n=1 Tax=Candidatus Vogelbacteria bacterium CG10_big_fil_rev_8_21_14_0_10_49_38 TaxID=1975043 RepID=A0A2H0RHH5_9BACT|nr:MAG: hypothetical protein BK006_01945 [bacterium CG10_49_38]PIR46012.1 MAG: dolichol-P-glucose synthetase [Candidatus Vogelbacteria bacterium CG10_big_fil_rev_8_21_14_0_10_49_38]
MTTDPELSVILPCRNEAAALPICLQQIRTVIAEHQLDAEVIVSDSSVDRSPEIARSFGAILVKHDQLGYGRAYLAGFEVAAGRYLFLADADGTYDFKEIPRFLSELRAGADLVIGDRFRGRIESGAMPWLHRRVGNPALSFLFRLFFRSPVRDVHCGLRAISRSALARLNLRATGMEFASEMIITAVNQKLKIKELAIDYHRRLGRSKLRSWPDGWRHLRFMLMFAPDYLFFGPGGLLILAGLGAFAIWSANASYGAFMFLLGWQIIFLGLFTKTYMKVSGFIKEDRLVEWLARHLRFETGLLVGLIFLLLSLSLKLGLVFEGARRILVWPADTVIILGLTLAVFGVQAMFASFLISILLVAKK